MIQQTIDLALGRAFTPDPIDTGVPLARRYTKKPLIATTIYKDGIEAAPVSFAGGALVIGQPEFVGTGGDDVDATFLRTFAERHKAHDCVINLATGYTAILSTRARRPESDEDAIAIMRDNPERLLGEPPAHGCRHSLAFHPTHNFAIIFAHKENDINAAVALAAKADLGIARLQCGMASLLIQVIGQFWNEVDKEAEFLFVDRASLFYLPVTEGAFGRPLFDVGLKEAALSQAVTERVAKLKAGVKVILVNSSSLDVEGMIRERGTGLTVVTPLKDKTSPALWACCSDKPRLGYDLFPNERMVRPFAPARLRPVPFVFWGALVASIAIIGLNAYRTAQAQRLAEGLKGQSQMLDSAMKQNEIAIHDVQSRARLADAMANWLLISPSTQALLIGITKEVEAATGQALKENKSAAQVDSLSITLQEGQPQMRLILVVLGDGPAANRIFQHISALFGRMGYSTVDLKESLVPQGFRYEHLVNMPKSPGL